MEEKRFASAGGSPAGGLSRRGQPEPGLLRFRTVSDSEGYNPGTAAYKYEQLQTRSMIRSLLSLFSSRPDPTLLSFDQVQALLRPAAGVSRGTRMIPISHIVGSVGRYRDFDRAFLPLNPASEERWKRIDVAMHGPRGLPPIDVYLVGEVYFVRDGNHRVSVARANGLEEIEARVTEIPTRVPLTADLDVDDLIRKAEYARFQEETGLDESRPQADIDLTEPGRYEQLLEHVRVHRYYLGLERGHDVALPEAAQSWYDHVYLPVIESVRQSRVLEEFPHRTEADLYLWVAWHRERLKEKYGVPPRDQEVAAGLAERFSERPLARFLKMLRRILQAALAAAHESPAPPETARPPDSGENPPSPS